MQFMVHYRPPIEATLAQGLFLLPHAGLRRLPTGDEDTEAAGRQFLYAAEQFVAKNDEARKLAEAEEDE